MNTAEAWKQIDEFAAHYKYDGTYMRELLESSPAGFMKFNNFLPLSSHKEKLSTEDYWVAKLAAMQAEDCGECLQLNVRMALEAGLSKDLIKAVLSGGKALPENLRDVYRYARGVARHAPVEDDLMARMEARYDKGALLEFGLCIASAKVFPTIKRAVGYAKSCMLIAIEV
jgi:alkylhydroperoxidase/carboxymuconolactone decarboxylase family protein YurZ